MKSRNHNTCLDGGGVEAAAIVEASIPVSIQSARGIRVRRFAFTLIFITQLTAFRRTRSRVLIKIFMNTNFFLV